MKPGRPSKIGKISPKTLRRRIKPVLSQLKSICNDSGIEMSELLGTIGRKFYLENGENYDSDKGNIFSKLSDNVDPYVEEIPLDLALYLKSSLEIGDRKYHHLRKVLSPYLRLPSKNKVRIRKHQICPAFENSFNQGKPYRM